MTRHWQRADPAGLSRHRRLCGAALRAARARSPPARCPAPSSQPGPALPRRRHTPQLSRPPAPHRWRCTPWLPPGPARPRPCACAPAVRMGSALLTGRPRSGDSGAVTALGGAGLLLLSAQGKAVWLRRLTRSRSGQPAIEASLSAAPLLTSFPSEFSRLTRDPTLHPG